MSNENVGRPDIQMFAVSYAFCKTLQIQRIFMSICICKPQNSIFYACMYFVFMSVTCVLEFLLWGLFRISTQTIYSYEG